MIWLLVFLVGLILYAGALFLVAWYLLHPMRIPIFLSPGSLGLPQESTSTITADRVTIKGWWMHHPEPKAVVILAHGYMMNRAEGIPLAKRLLEAGYSALVFDFRAHGVSGGKMCSIGWDEQQDIVAVDKLARQRYPDSKIVHWGSSMGGAAMALSAAHHNVRPDAMILDSTYDRLDRSNDGWWQTFTGPRWKHLIKPVWLWCWLLTRTHPSKMNVSHALSQIDFPVLMLYGTDDLIVPRDQAQHNVDAARNGRVVWFDGCQHSQPRWFQTEAYDRVLLEFLDEVLSLPVQEVLITSDQSDPVRASQ